MSTISPVPPPKQIKFMYGQLLTPAPGRLTPTGPGRMKAPPVCLDPLLKRVASSIGELNTSGVCFSQKEADSCAEKALMLDRKAVDNVNIGEEKLLNSQTCDTDLSWNSHSVSPLGETSDVHANVSSSSTVVTASSSSSCGRSAMSDEIAVVASLTVNIGPPLEVVRTDLADNSEDESTGATSPVQQSIDLLDARVTTTLEDKSRRASSPTTLSTTFTNRLVSEKSSRQGRSRQRYLVHPSTEELVREVAGSIPITRDGRIILVSASRKTEWILPKGGWDTDETKEECAARETFEEGGFLGRLGGCLGPIDYETGKAKKRRLSQMGNYVVKKSKGDEGLRPSNCSKSETSVSTMASTELTSSTASMAGSASLRGCVNTIPAHQHPPPMPEPIEPKKHSYVRLSLFPLYVTSVKSDWPEKGRLRKLVDIDEAIKIMDAENRLYFKKGLEMVKERGLHLLKP